MRFKVGDRVLYTTWSKFKGTIVVFDKDCGVEFDDINMGLHSCDGAGKEGQCMWVDMHHITLIEKRILTPRESVMF